LVIERSLRSEHRLGRAFFGDQDIVIDSNAKGTLGVATLEYGIPRRALEEQELSCWTTAIRYVRGFAA